MRLAAYPLLASLVFAKSTGYEQHRIAEPRFAPETIELRATDTYLLPVVSDRMYDELMRRDWNELAGAAMEQFYKNAHLANVISRYAANMRGTQPAREAYSTAHLMCALLDAQAKESGQDQQGRTPVPTLTKEVVVRMLREDTTRIYTRIMQAELDTQAHNPNLERIILHNIKHTIIDETLPPQRAAMAVAQRTYAALLAAGDEQARR